MVDPSSIHFPTFSASTGDSCIFKLLYCVINIFFFNPVVSDIVMLEAFTRHPNGMVVTVFSASPRVSREVEAAGLLTETPVCIVFTFNYPTSVPTPSAQHLPN